MKSERESMKTIWRKIKIKICDENCYYDKNKIKRMPERINEFVEALDKKDELCFLISRRRLTMFGTLVFHVSSRAMVLIDVVGFNPIIPIKS